LLITAVLVFRIYQMEKTKLSRRGEMQEKREKKKLVVMIASLLTGSVAIFLAFTLHIAIALIFGFVSALAIAVGSSWSYRGRAGKAAASGEDTSWFSRGHSSGNDHTSSGGSGGGFGGGSSGGGGSSTGF